jgi:hypothetical protein
MEIKLAKLNYLNTRKNGIEFVLVVFMKNNYTAAIKQDGDWWIGWIEEFQGSIARKPRAMNFWRVCALR